MSYYNWNEIMSKKSTEELVRIAKEKGREPEEKVNAAIMELKKRGFDTTDYSLIPEIIKKNNKPDENSPSLYSKTFIIVFSLLFSVLFGGILLAINIKEIGNKKGIAPTIIFSFLYTFFTIYFLSLINVNSGVGLAFTAIGAIILKDVFWNKYIGKEIVYHKKSFVKPLIIGLIIFIALIIFFIWASTIAVQ